MCLGYSLGLCAHEAALSRGGNERRVYAVTEAIVAGFNTELSLILHLVVTCIIILDVFD